MRRPLPEPAIRRLAPGRDHLLLEDVIYRCWHRYILIPEGFVYDKSSVPRLLHSLISPTDLSDLAPLLHDWLYRTPAARACSGGVLRPLRRKDADRIFHDVMALQGVSPIRLRLAYAAVRLFGAFAYKK